MVIEDQRNAVRKGREEGIEEGIEEGMRRKALEIAKQFLDVVDDQTLSQKTGLTLEDIQQLRQG
jgi:predicted transposase YdaD